MKRGESWGTQATGQIGINHGPFLFGCVAQATLAVGFHDGFIDSCHRSKNYDADDFAIRESSDGAMDPAYVRTLTAEYPAAVAGKNYLTMTARVRKIHTAMTLVPQANSSLGLIDTPASAGLVASFLVSGLGDFEQRTWIHTQAIEDSPGGRGFMRLKLSGD